MSDKQPIVIKTLRVDYNPYGEPICMWHESSVCEYATYTPKPKDERPPWDDIKRVNIRDRNAACDTLFDLVDE